LFSASERAVYANAAKYNDEAMAKAGMLENLSNAYVKAMNGLLQQTKSAARGFKNATNFIMIAYLRMSRLTQLPSNLLQDADAPKYNALIHRCL